MWQSPLSGWTVGTTFVTSRPRITHSRADLARHLGRRIGLNSNIIQLSLSLCTIQPHRTLCGASLTAISTVQGLLWKFQKRYDTCTCSWLPYFQGELRYCREIFSYGSSGRSSCAVDYILASARMWEISGSWFKWSKMISPRSSNGYK